MQKRFKRTICVYCAINLATTDDHVLAKEFLLLDQRKKKENILLVPACEDCNSRKSELENYLTAVLPFGGRHEDARLSLESVLPRLSRHPSIRRSLAQEHGRVWNKEKSELYIQRMVLPIQPGSIEKLLEFIVKGLVWYYWRSYLTVEYCVEVNALLEREEHLIEHDFSNISPQLKVAGNLGNGTFAYEGFRDPDSPQTTAWRFSLYGGLQLGGGPKERRVLSTSYHAYTGPIEVQQDIE